MSLKAYDQNDVLQPLDVSSATGMFILLRDPDGIKKSLNAVLVSDGVDGLIHGFTQTGTIDKVGLWSMQGWVQFGTNAFHSSIHNFTAEASLYPDV